MEQLRAAEFRARQQALAVNQQQQQQSQQPTQTGIQSSFY
jgi:hypothetical protein